MSDERLKECLDQIEYDIAQNKMSAGEVFTQMRQLIDTRPSQTRPVEVEEAVEASKEIIDIFGHLRVDGKERDYKWVIETLISAATANAAELRAAKHARAMADMDYEAIREENEALKANPADKDVPSVGVGEIMKTANFMVNSGVVLPDNLETCLNYLAKHANYFSLKITKE